MKIYIVRHGQILSNLIERHTINDEDLTLVGISQAKDLSKKIGKLDFDIVISSPFIRAIHTANIINTKNKKLIIDDRIRERSSGDLSGKPHSLVNRDEYWNYFTTIQYGTSENIKDFFERVNDFINELKTKDYDTVLIVTHSGVSKAFSAYFEGIKDGLFLNRGLKNCEVKEYTL